MKALDSVAFAAGTQGMSTQNGPALMVGHMDTIGASVTATPYGAGSLIGTLKIQVSNDPNPDAAAPYTQAGAPAGWSDLANAVLSIGMTPPTTIAAITCTTTTTTTPVTVNLPAQNICAKFARAVWTFTSGVGTINVNVHATGQTN